MTKILILSLCAAALSLSSCQKKPLPSTPPPAEQKVPVGFRPMSQAVWVKSTDEKSFPHTDFGVWGIARHSGHIYSLWGNTELIQVTPIEGSTSNEYSPVSVAYWLKGYEYNFLAVAPYYTPDSEEFELTSVTPVENSEEVDPVDQMSFKYDFRSKYTANDYEFDLLGAAAVADNQTGGRTQSQQLKFWHLFSQITVNVSFGKDDQDKQIDGTVSQIKLTNIDADGVFTISYDDAEANPTLPLNVTCDEGSLTAGTVVFSAATGTFNIIPHQKVSDFDLRINFKIDEGDGRLVSYEDFRIDLSALGDARYNSNERYNWNITIGDMNKISFTVEVEDWTPDTTLPEIDIK